METFTSIKIFLIKESLLKINCKKDLGGITNHLISIWGEKSKDEISAGKDFSAKPTFSPFHLAHCISIPKFTFSKKFLKWQFQTVFLLTKESNMHPI